jgi:hypothetical protein
MEIVLISLGNFQEYLIENLEQLLKFNNQISVIIDKEFNHFLEKYHHNSNVKIIFSEEFDLTDFEKNNKLDIFFRNGFWKLTSKRLFVLYQYLKKYNLSHVIHLENDVLFYENGKELMKKLKLDKLYLTLDAPNRVIPGIIYIPNYTYLSDLILNYQYHLNDMMNMTLFYYRNQNKIETFPLMGKNESYNYEDLFTKNFNQFYGIFDGAAIGQYLGGIDPRNKSGDTTGFINETCKIKYNHYKFIWKRNQDNLNLPYIVIDGEVFKIYNLHIHSKNLKKFIS